MQSANTDIVEIDESIAWDRNAASRLEELSRNDDPAYRALVHKALATLREHLLRGSTILDVGSGLGFLTAAMCAEGYQVTAVDPSIESVRLATDFHQTLSAHTFHACTMHEFASVTQQRFNAVVANMTLHSVAHLQTFFMDARDILDDQGIIYVAIPNPKTYLQTRIDLSLSSVDLSVSQKLRLQFRIRDHVAHPAPVTYYHRPLKEYISAASAARFSVIDFDVPAHIGPGRSADITFMVFGPTTR